MIVLYAELHIILKPSNVKICKRSIFFLQLLNKNMFNETVKIRRFIVITVL